MTRYWRIAFSATCLIASVLLIVLWVRSYQIIDSPHVRLSGYILCRITSFQGCMYFRVDKVQALNEFPPRNPGRYEPSWFWPRWGWWAPTTEEYANGRPIPKARFPWFSYTAFKTFCSLQTPIWFWLMICGAIAAAPWIRQLRWRFSLRTLLIVSTLIAVVLGLIVVLAR